MKLKNKQIKCNSLFNNLIKKSEFSYKELNIIKRNFIRNFLYSRLVLLFSLYGLISIPTITSLLCLSTLGWDVIFGNVIVSSIVLLFVWVVIFILVLVVLCTLNHKVNRHLTYNIFTGAIHMGVSKDLIGSSDRELYKILNKDFNEGLIKLLKSSKRTFNTDTHEVIKRRLDKTFSNNDSVEYHCELKGRKPIKEKFLSRNLNTCIRLYRSIGLEGSKDFDEVKKMLTSTNVYRITIKRVKEVL